MEKLKLNIQQFASGTISGGTYNARYSYFMTWTSVSNGSIANTSNVTLNWVFKKTATDSYNAYNTSGSSKVTLVINGSSSGSLRADFDLRNAAVGTEKVIATYTVNNIPHNADGTCTINVSGSHVTGLNWGTKSIGNTAITLDRIPRYATCSQSLDSANSTETSLRINWSSDSTIDYVWYSTDNGSTWKAVGSVNATSGNYTISQLSASNTNLSAGTSYSIKTRVRRKDSQLTTDSSANSWATFSYPYINTVGTVNLTIGSPQTLTLYNPKGRSVTVYMKHNNTTGTQIYSGSTSSTTAQFTPTASTMYNLIPNAKSGNCVYYVVYGGNTSATKSGTFVVNENNNKPSVTSYTPYDNNTRTYNLTGDRNKIVLNASTMQLTIVANAKNNATFNNNGYIKVNGTSLSLTISGNDATGVYTITRPSSATFSIELKDSRGIPNTISYTLPNYVNYFIPTFVGSAVRNQPTDGKINLSGRGTFFNGSFGSQSNTITVNYGVFDLATQEQLTAGTFTVTTSGNNHTEAQVQVSGADYQKQWAVLFQVVDKFLSTSSTVQVPKGVPIFNWDEDEFDINVTTKLKSDATIDGNTTIGGTATIGGNTTMGGTLSVTGNTTINGTTRHDNDITLRSGKNVFSTSGNSIMKIWGDGDLTFSADGKTLYLGYQNTTGLNFLGGIATMSSSSISVGGLPIVTNTPTGANSMGRFKLLPRTTNSSIGSTTTTSDYLQKLLKWICNTYPGYSRYTYIGQANPNSEGNIMIHIYDTSTKNASTGLPQYSSGVYFQLGGGVCVFGTSNYSFYVNNYFQQVELYYNSTGQGTGTITLNETSANYSCIEVFYKPNADVVYTNKGGDGSVKIYYPNNRRFQMTLDYDNNTYWYHCLAQWKFSGNTIVKQSEIRWRVAASTAAQTRTDITSNDSNIYIYKVVGYKL